MKKITLSLLLCIVMCLSLIPMSALAANIDYDVWVGGVRVTSANKDNILDNSGTPTATYDPDTNTLTLNDYGGGYINANTALDIVLADGTENAISVPAEVAECGIRINGDCTIRGNGDLNIEVLNPGYDGVWVGGDLTVDMTGDLTVNAGDDGLYANNNLTISGSGDVDIDSHYYGICADGGDVVISGAGDVTVKAATATGILGCKSVIVSGDGDLTVTSYKHGIYTDNGNITISGGGNRTFYSTYGSDNEYFRAVYSSQGDIDISGTGTLTIASALSSSSEYDVGLYSYWGSLRVSGSVVLDISDVNIGTYSEKATTFASSGEMTVDASVWGVGSSNDIIFSGTGKATISGGEYGAYLSESGKSVLLNGTGTPISLTAGEGYKAVWNIADSSSPVGGTNIANYDVTGAPNEQSVVYTLKCSHTPVTITGKVATCTEDGWKDYYECSLCHKYFEDNACEAEIADLDVWKAAGGNGYIPKLEPTPEPEPEPISYKIIEGANSVWVIAADEDPVFRSNADFSKFSHVLLDGKELAKKYYKAESGSTLITLTPEYTATLSVGKHTIEIVSTDGSASTVFYIEETIANTDGEGFALSTAAMSSAFIGCNIVGLSVVFFEFKKKKKVR